MREPSALDDAERLLDMLHKDALFKDKMIGGKNRHDGGRIALVQMHQRQKNAGSGIFVLRLNDDALLRSRSDLAAYLGELKVFPGDDSEKCSAPESTFRRGPRCAPTWTVYR